MKIIFCDSVIDRKMVEPAYETEYLAAKANGLDTALISHEALVDEENLRKAIALVKSAPEKELAIYRGWMMPVEAYEKLYDGLLAKNIELVNTPEAYANGHLFPESYPLIKAQTPKSIIIPEYDMHHEKVLKAALSLLDGAAIVKDYVKSLKHYWEEACYIPDITNWEHASRVINRFIELQGSSLQGGLVLREYVSLRMIADHSQSGMPLAEEYRVFFLRRTPILIIPYWGEGTYDSSLSLPDELLSIGQSIESNFFTMDVARLEDGGWIIMELGDGQVAGLPERTNINDFYKLLL